MKYRIIKQEGFADKFIVEENIGNIWMYRGMYDFLLAAEDRIENLKNPKI